MVNVGVTGAGGRMGKAIISEIGATDGISLSGAVEHVGSPLIGCDGGEIGGIGKTGVMITDNFKQALKKSKVVIDFSHHDATMQNLEDVADEGKAIVIGTTGFSHQQRDHIKVLAKKASVVMAPNMSVGVNLLLKLVEEASRVVGAEYDIEVTETHHRHKKDAPSGTALRIAEVAAITLDRDFDDVAIYGRKGITGERSDTEIGIHSIRAGDVVGDHTITFAGPGERIELTHKAHSRSTFAAGAVRAALWLAGKPHGLYDMQDVLGFK